MAIKCENTLCIYQDGDECTLGGISLDLLGVCQSGIHVEPDEKDVAKKKSMLLAQYAADAAAGLDE